MIFLKNVSRVLSVIFVISLLLVSYPSSVNGAEQKAFFVSPGGSDKTGDGTIKRPFKTITKVRDTVRSYLKRTKITGDVVVYLRKGEYNLSDTLNFNEEDSGKNGKNVIYCAYNNEEAVISGGIGVKGWQKVYGKSYWKAKLNGIDYLRQLYINGERKQRASSEQPIKGVGWYDDKTNKEDPDNNMKKDGLRVNFNDIGLYNNSSDIELHWQVQWRDFYCPVSKIIDNGKGENGTKEKAIVMQQSYYNSAVNGLGAPPTFYDTPVYVINAFELLDKPGEWYFNRKTKELFYWPQNGEEMNKVKAVVPKINKLIEIMGSSLQKKVKNIQFKGITFQYSAWVDPSIEGWFGFQSEYIISPSNNLPADSLTPGALQISAAENIRFERNKFMNFGAAGINLFYGVNKSDFVGNVFTDISDAAMTIGNILDYKANADQQPCKYINISNNVINKIGQEYYGAPAIQAFYVEGINIAHNDISDIPYSGIAVGWGWSMQLSSTTCKNNSIRFNKIYNYMQKVWDGGGIYTLGQQPNSVCSNNYISDMKSDFAGLYFDEGTKFYTVENNVLENVPNWLYIWRDTIQDIKLNNNYTTTGNNINKGTRISVTNTTLVKEGNWPNEAKKIIENSGLEPQYKHLLK